MLALLLLSSDCEDIYNKHLSDYEKRTLGDLDSFNQRYFHCFPHIEIARRILYWKIHGAIPAFSGSVEGYGEMEQSCTFIDEINDKVLYILNHIEDNDGMTSIIQILSLLGPHGLYHLLGFRHTYGSSWILYPPRNDLISMFELLNNPKSKLTVGARALSKHCIRSIHKWPQMKGPEIVQNGIANAELLRILEHCIWMNIHQLPQSVITLELRTDDGYGVRWDITHSQFRGFLEPFLEDGFSQKWIHNE